MARWYSSLSIPCSSAADEPAESLKKQADAGITWGVKRSRNEGKKDDGVEQSARSQRRTPSGPPPFSPIISIRRPEVCIATTLLFSRLQYGG